jgi:hypothetical protein
MGSKVVIIEYLVYEDIMEVMKFTLFFVLLLQWMSFPVST